MFRMSNNCGDFLMFETPSRSRPDHPGHTVAVCKRSGWVSCTCEDSLMRKKGGNLFSPPDDRFCWHCRKFVQTLAPMLWEALHGGTDA